ncbi:hypothetical protein B0H10DRAFT_1954216 [Mycena sp. CBHHK59/15]|nr:hypothetical protein B0H10DRAFT_1954216 [Mycena sp. CBHHK59/15]
MRLILVRLRFPGTSRRVISKVLRDYGSSSCKPVEGETKDTRRFVRWFECKLLSAAAQDEEVASAFWHHARSGYGSFSADGALEGLPDPLTVSIAIMISGLLQVAQITIFLAYFDACHLPRHPGSVRSADGRRGAKGATRAKKKRR